MCTGEATSLAHDVRPLDSVPGEEFGEAQGAVVFVAVMLGGGGPGQERRWITLYVEHETSRTQGGEGISLMQTRYGTLHKFGTSVMSNQGKICPIASPRRGAREASGEGSAGI